MDNEKLEGNLLFDNNVFFYSRQTVASNYNKRNFLAADCFRRLAFRVDRIIHPHFLLSGNVFIPHPIHCPKRSLPKRQFPSHTLQGDNENIAAGARVLIFDVPDALNLLRGQVRLLIPAREGARELVAISALQRDHAGAAEGVTDRRSRDGLADVAGHDGGRAKLEESVDGGVVVVRLREATTGAVLRPLVP